MIHFYAARNFRWTMERFLKDWAPHLRKRVRLVAYDAVAHDAVLRPGLHLLTDFERLTPAERYLARHLHRRLAGHPATHLSLQDPAAWKGRFGLLEALATEGVNDVRYPAFVRWADDHRGSIGAPVSTVEEARDRVGAEMGRVRRLVDRRLMLVEMVDARGTDGLFRKYAAMRVGDRIIARHVLVSDDWVTKTPDIVTDKTVQEEREFVEEFPHEEQVRAVFDTAGLRYGRIDYGMVDGRIQVWEINTNPVIVPRRRHIDPLRLDVQVRSAEAIAVALEQVDLAGAKGADDIRVFGDLGRSWWRLQGRASRRHDAHRR